MFNSRFQEQPPGRRPRPQEEILIAHETKNKNAQIDIGDNRWLNIHLIYHQLKSFEVLPGYEEDTVIIEDSPFEVDIWYEIIITLTRMALPQEITKARHQGRLQAGKPVFIRSGKTFKYDLRNAQKCIPEVFPAWLQEQNLSGKLLAEVQDIVCSWIENKTE